MRETKYYSTFLKKNRKLHSKKKRSYSYFILFLMLQILFFSSVNLTSFENPKNALSHKTTTPIKLSSNGEYDKIVDDFLVNNYTDQTQSYPSICALSNETIAIAWESFGQDGSSMGIYARVFDATTGTNITSEFQVNYETYSSQMGPSICALSNETIAIAWESYFQDGDGSGIYARVFNATTGTNITSEFQVNYETSGTQLNPSICALKSDILAVTWQSSGQDGSGSGIYARVFNATTGTSITSEFRVNYETYNDQLNPSICAIKSDTFAVTWQSYFQDGDGHGIYARIFDATTGTSITSEFQVNYETSGSQQNPSICALSNDIIAITWRGEGTQDSNGIYVRLFDATTGVPLGSQFIINNFILNEQRMPSISRLSNSSFVVTWDSELQDGSKWGVYGRTFDFSKSSPYSSEFLVNDYRTDDQRYSSPCALSNETFAVVWHGYGVDDDYNFGVYAAIFGPGSPSASALSNSNSNGNDDNDDDDKSPEAISGFDTYLIIVSITIISLLAIQKRKKVIK